VRRVQYNYIQRRTRRRLRRSLRGHLGQWGLHLRSRIRVCRRTRCLTRNCRARAGNFQSQYAEERSE
jgi:hypothetical protein